jgi:hypothetical protein
MATALSNSFDTIHCIFTYVDVVQAAKKAFTSFTAAKKV